MWSWPFNGCPGSTNFIKIFDPETGDILGIVDEYVALRDPGRPIPPRATAVHGIRDADVRGKRLDERRIRALMEQAEFLVAHNARFDRAFVERLFPCARKKQWHCSMSEIPWKGLGFRSRGLHNLLADHNIRIALPFPHRSKRPVPVIDISPEFPSGQEASHHA